MRDNLLGHMTYAVMYYSYHCLCNSCIRFKEIFLLKLWHKSNATGLKITVKYCSEQKLGSNTTLIICQCYHLANERECGRFVLYQISVDETVSLQVLHPFTHILTHAQQHISVEMTLPLSEEIQKAALFHELGNDVNWSLLGAHTIKLHQLRVCQFPGREVVHTHSYYRKRGYCR